MSISRKGENNPFYGKKHSEESLILLKAAATNRDKLPVPGLEVTDLDTKITTIYKSIREAAKAIGSDIKTILRREKLQIEKGINTPYREKYMIVIKR
jgi:NUMOD3 motif/NUMOD1 domain